MSTSNQSTKDTNTKELPNPQGHHHHEDRLVRTWRSLGTSVVLATSKAEKAVRERDNKAVLKEMDDAVVGFFKTRLEWGRLVSYLEAKLEGKAKEMETLQHYVRSQPTIGIRRKRKRNEQSDEANGTSLVSSSSTISTGATNN